MNVDELLKVAEGLAWVSDRMSDLPEAKEEAMQSALFCSIARLIVLELSKHMVDGVEPYEALRRTACGELELSPSQATVFTLLNGLRKIPKE